MARQRPIAAARANLCCPPLCGRCASGRPAAGLDPTPAIQAPPCAWLRLPTRADVASQAGVTDFPAASCIRMPGERGTVVARRARASQPRNHDEHPTEPALLRSACVPAVDRLRWRDPRTRDAFAVTGQRWSSSHGASRGGSGSMRGSRSPIARAGFPARGWRLARIR